MANSVVVIYIASMEKAPDMLKSNRIKTMIILIVCENRTIILLEYLSAIYPEIGASNILGKLLHKKFIAKLVADPVMESTYKLIPKEYVLDPK